MGELAEIPLPAHATEVRVPEGFMVRLSPEYARALVVCDELFRGMWVVSRRRLAHAEAP